MNEYVFLDNEKSIRINKYDLPSPWINYISNGSMHGFISQAAGGTLWLGDNPAFFRLTRYRQNNLPIDSPGFYIYIREKDGTVWSPAFRPVEAPLDSFYAKHFGGKTVFYAEKNGTKAELTVFIAPDYDICVWSLQLTSKEDKDFDVFAYMELSQGNIFEEFKNSYYYRHMIKTWYDKDLNAVMYLSHNAGHPKAKELPLVYFGTDKEVVSYCGDRDAFTGNYRTERNPVSVENGILDNREIQSGEPCAALHIKVNCKKDITQNASFFFGAEKGGTVNYAEAFSKAKENLNNINVTEQLYKLDNNWSEFLDKFVCEIPDQNAKRQINIWGPIASMHTANYSRCINAIAPGTRTLGYRDTCQDMLAITYRNIGMAKERLLYLMSKQYKAGNAIHCEGELNSPIPDYKVRCDDHLWPHFLAYSIIAEEGNADILDKKVCYLADDHISDGEEATVWEHLLAAIDYTQNNLGSHGLPLTYKGDWNDIIHKFSEAGKGESVFAAQQYAKILELTIEMAKYIGDSENESKLTDYLSQQQENINKYCWNGKWWYRCFDDDGNPIGSEADRFGKIWLNSQTWSVIGNSGTAEMQRAAMDAVKERLDTGVGLMKLAPGFETYPEITDPFSGYNPGTGENGAVFCHAHTWAVVAEAILGNGENAWKYYNDLVPHNCIEKLGVERYQSEPYSWCSNIVGYPNNKQGWGNVSHISGTVAWMNVAATQYLLGVRPVLKGIEFDPCIPKSWDGFKVERDYRGTRLYVTVENPQHISKGVKYIEVDGQKIDSCFADEKLFAGKVKAEIKVIMG